MERLSRADDGDGDDADGILLVLVQHGKRRQVDQGTGVYILARH